MFGLLEREQYNSNKQIKEGISNNFGWYLMYIGNFV